MRPDCPPPARAAGRPQRTPAERADEGEGTDHTPLFKRSGRCHVRQRVDEREKPGPSVAEPAAEAAPHGRISNPDYEAVVILDVVIRRVAQDGHRHRSSTAGPGVVVQHSLDVEIGVVAVDVVRVLHDLRPNPPAPTTMMSTLAIPFGQQGVVLRNDGHAEARQVPLE